MPVLAFVPSTPRDWSEEELLRRTLRHEPRAWAELVRRYRAVIFSCITRVLARGGALFSATDADEVYADLMMSLVRDDLRKLRLYDPARGARLGSWLGLLAKNAAHDFLRSSVHRPLADGDLDGAAEVDDADGSSPLDDMLRSERWRRLEGMLAEHSDKDRELFALYFGRGLSPEEVAAVMNISVKTVYTKKHKLLTRLATMAQASFAA